MSYEPTNWKDGDLVTSAKLNKIEQGIANGVEFEVVNMQCDFDSGFISLDKTVGEINNILKSGKHILVTCMIEPPSDAPSEAYQYLSAIPTGISYTPEFGFQILLDFPMYATSNGMLILTATSLDQYPSFNGQNN